MKNSATLRLLILLLFANPLMAAEINTPQEQFNAYPSRLADLPPGWATTKPIRLQVYVNLKYAPNSPEADKFLQTWYRSIKAMPHQGDAIWSQAKDGARGISGEICLLRIADVQELG